MAEPLFSLRVRMSFSLRAGFHMTRWTSSRDRRMEIRYVQNITMPFPEDDNLFIHELIAVFPLLTVGMISSTSPPKLRCLGEMHSSRASAGLADVHLRCRTLGANP